MRLKGYALAALAAALYGTNPALAVPMYKMGMNALSVIICRYVLGFLLLGILLLWVQEGIGLKCKEIFPVTLLGITMAISSLALYEAYNYMNPGVASTLLFMYPILTALIMTFFYGEKFRLITCVCLTIMAAGLYLLMFSAHGVALDFTGVALIALSSLTYAIYLVMIKVSRTIKLIPTIKSLFYQLLAGSVFFSAIALVGGAFTPPHDLGTWVNAWSLALLPTVLSLLCTIKAINYIGPTPTAIFGALEPVTAVCLSWIILGEAVTLREICGGALIIVSTVLVVLGKQENSTDRA